MMAENRKPCLLPWTHMYYHSDKGVYPCCKLAGVDKFKLGSTTDSLDTLWNSDKLKQLRKDIINQTEPSECFYHCFNNINPLHLYLPEEYRLKQTEFFSNTDSTGAYPVNLVIWNVNESNVCNFRCVYCCSEFSNRFDGSLRKSFDKLEDMISLFETNVDRIEKLFLSSGETVMQKGYYKILNLLLERGKTDIEINIHSNFSKSKFGDFNFFDLINKFSNITLFASLDSHGKRAEYIREGTVWKDIEDNRQLLTKYTNVKFAVQSVITNLNLWSLPDFHQDWYARGFVRKDNIRYFCLTTPKELHISVLSDKMKEKILLKYESYLKFLEDEQSESLNCMTPFAKINQILDKMKEPPTVPLGQLDLFLIKNNIKKQIFFKQIFPEFVN